MTEKQVSVLLAALIAVAACGSNSNGNGGSGTPVPPNATAITAPVLPRIETYMAPPNPKSSDCGEPWDCRKRSPLSYPQTTKTEALAEDVCVFVREELDPTTVPARIKRDDVAEAINRYLDRPWEKTRGLRPWAHMHFIRALSDPERQKLADDLTAFIQKNITSRVCSSGDDRIQAP